MPDIQSCIDAALNTPYAYGGPAGQGIIRRHAEDYIVDEIPLLEPDGEGEHVWLKIRKRHTNTDFVARQLQNFAGVRPVAVSYAGLKDRHALTTQWFSVHLPGEMPDWQTLASDELEILEVKRHARKLRRGTLKGNHFQIIIRDAQPDAARLTELATRISSGGVPNYFGGQRFGHDGQNLLKAMAMFEGKRVKRHQRSMYLSAVRSMIFNAVLARRVEEGSWNTLQAGDVCLRTGRRGFFPVESIDDELLERLGKGEIHPTGPLWGEGDTAVRGNIAELEQSIASDYSVWCEGLEKARLDMDRRALRLIPENFSCKPIEEGVRLEFDLPAGCYATTVIRELLDVKDYDRFNNT